MSRATKKKEKEKQRKKASTVDLSRRAKIVMEHPIRSEMTVRVRTDGKRYNYDFITDGANPTKEERKRALRRVITTRLQLEKR